MGGVHSFCSPPCSLPLLGTKHNEEYILMNSCICNACIFPGMYHAINDDIYSRILHIPKFCSNSGHCFSSRNYIIAPQKNYKSLFFLVHRYTTDICVSACKHLCKTCKTKRSIFIFFKSYTDIIQSNVSLLVNACLIYLYYRERTNASICEQNHLSVVFPVCYKNHKYHIVLINNI